MKYAIIENGKIINTVEADDDFAKQQGWKLLPHGGIGWDWNEGDPQPPSDVQTPQQKNQAILDALAAIDSKSIRAVREGDQERINAWNAEAAALRAQLVKV